MFFWKGGLVGAVVEAAGRESVVAAATRVLARANEHVPFRMGILEDTGKVSSDGTQAVISYDTAYAARLHQHPEYNFQGKGRGRWLTLAIEADKSDTLEHFAGPFRDKLGRFAVRPG